MMARFRFNEYETSRSPFFNCHFQTKLVPEKTKPDAPHPETVKAICTKRGCPYCRLFWTKVNESDLGLSKFMLFLDKTAKVSGDFVQIIHYFGQSPWFFTGVCPNYHFFWTNTIETDLVLSKFTPLLD